VEMADNSVRWEFQPVADQAVNIDFGELIDEEINLRITSLAAAINNKRLTGVTACIPTYRSLTVAYDSALVRQSHLIECLKELITTVKTETKTRKCWYLPVCYGGKYGVDLPASAQTLALSPDELIRLHTATCYRIYMIGFMPGFAYLGGLDARLHIPRRTAPRQSVPAGSVSIGGIQTAVGSVAAPSGWHLLGQTPVKSFDPLREQPFLFTAGEYIEFVPIKENEYVKLADDRGYMPDWNLRA
jgi:inhibitor of KinA